MYVVRIYEPMCEYEVDVLFIIRNMCLIKFLNIIHFKKCRKVCW